MKISLTDISKTFGSGHTAVEAIQNIALEIAPGKMTALTGPSGSGKTTLLNLVGGLDTPDRGEIRVGETQINSLDETGRSLFRRNHVGIIFQQFNLLADLTAAENIELPLILNQRPSAERRLRVDHLLTQLDLQDQAQAFPNTLSGGEQQRVAIARAIAHRPWVLLADEPTANLDSKSADQVVELLKRLHQEDEITVLLTTHDPKVSCHADQILSLVDGALK